MTSCLISSGKAAKKDGSTPSGTSPAPGAAGAVLAVGGVAAVSDTVALLLVPTAGVEELLK